MKKLFCHFSVISESFWSHSAVVILLSFLCRFLHESFLCCHFLVIVLSVVVVVVVVLLLLLLVVVVVVGGGNLCGIL